MEKKSTSKKIGYNQAVEQIEEILEKINGQELDIDTLAEEVKKATELIRMCREKLRKAEQEIGKVLENEEF